MSNTTMRPAVAGPLESTVGRHSAPAYKGWELLHEMPSGWSIDRTVGSPLAGHAFITDGRSTLRGGKRALLCIVKAQAQLNFDAPEYPASNEATATILPSPEQPSDFVFDAGQARTVNNLARQKFKHRLLADIMVDLQICEIEGWSKLEYIHELRALINGLGRNDVTPNVGAERPQTAAQQPE